MSDAIVWHVSGHKLDNPILVQLERRKLLVSMHALQALQRIDGHQREGCQGKGSEASSPNGVLKKKVYYNNIYTYIHTYILEEVPLISSTGLPLLPRPHNPAS